MNDLKIERLARECIDSIANSDGTLAPDHALVADAIRKAVTTQDAEIDRLEAEARIMRTALYHITADANIAIAEAGDDDE